MLRGVAYISMVVGWELRARRVGGLYQRYVQRTGSVAARASVCVPRGVRPAAMRGGGQPPRTCGTCYRAQSMTCFGAAFGAKPEMRSAAECDSL